MAKRRKRRAGQQGDLLDSVQDYRHEGAKRKNNPPARIAAERTIIGPRRNEVMKVQRLEQ